MGYMTAYSASKFAVRGLTQATGRACFLVFYTSTNVLYPTKALELRPHKITVNAYAPGMVLTPMSTS